MTDLIGTNIKRYWALHSPEYALLLSVVFEAAEYHCLFSLQLFPIPAFHGGFSLDQELVSSILGTLYPAELTIPGSVQQIIIYYRKM